MQPQKMRETRYRYMIEFLRHHLRHSTMLRFDHVMGLRRLFWVPHRFPAKQGAYVEYPFEELCALLCLESHRHQAVLVGENLGTVPPEVNAGLHRHHFREMYVVQYELQPKPLRALRPVPVRCVASLNTHDMPTFQSHRCGLDIVDRADLGLLSTKMIRKEHARRQSLNRILIRFLERQGWLPKNSEVGRALLSAPHRAGCALSWPGALGSGSTGTAKPHRSMSPVENKLLAALLAFLAASPAETVLVNLEDLWAETSPQNVPGTSTQRVNWQRKTRFTLEQICQTADLSAILTRLNLLRKQRISHAK